MSNDTVAGALLGYWVDGVAAAPIPANDRGLHYGDGLFETIACAQGRLCFEALHWERLERGCARLGLHGLDWEALRAEALRAAAVERGLVKVIVTRGGGGRGYAPRDVGPPRRIVLQYGWPDESSDTAAAAATLTWSEVALAPQPLLAGLKHLNRLEQVLARARLEGSGADEALMCSEDGEVICGTMSNVFIVRRGGLLTPPVDRAGVAGVIRAVLLRDAAELGLSAAEASLRRADVEAAEEVFLTNSRWGIRPVRVLGARQFESGPLTRRLQAHLRSIVT